MGGFVFFAEGGGALVEAGYFGFAGFEEAEREAGGGGGVGVPLADFGNAGIGDDALPGFEAAEEPGFLGDAEDQHFFGGGGGRVGVDVPGEQGFEGGLRFVLVQKVGAEPGLAEGSGLGCVIGGGLGRVIRFGCGGCGCGGCECGLSLGGGLGVVRVVRVYGKFERLGWGRLSGGIVLMSQGVLGRFRYGEIVRIVRVFVLDLGGTGSVDGGADEGGFS